MNKTLDGLQVAVLACDGVERPELVDPRRALEEAGAKTTLISTKIGHVQAFNHHDKAETFPVDAIFEHVGPDAFDAVLLPGGALNADQLRMSESARNFVREMDRAGKPVAVICHAPWLLVSAGLVQGRHLTSWPSVQDDIRNAGGTWSDEQVVIDRNWVSSRKPADIPAFNDAMIELFAHQHAAA